jgi:signal transduction histidine kinase
VAEAVAVGNSGDAGSAARDAERALVRLEVLSRAGQLLFSALMVAGDRHRYRRPKLQWCLLALATAESGWLASRLLRQGKPDRTTNIADGLFAAVGMVVCQAGLGDGEGALWMKNLAIGAVLGASGFEHVVDRVGAVAAVGSAALWCSARPRGREARVAGVTLAANEVINMVGEHLAARFYVAGHRRYAALTDEARAVAVARAAEAAAQAERSRQHRLFHAMTVQVLRDVACSDDAETASALARREAARLRYALRTQGESPTPIDDALRKVCESLGAQGRVVELVTSEATIALDRATVGALAEATDIALGAAHEFGAAPRAVVRASDDDARLTLTVRHHGAGFEPGTGTEHEARLHALAPMLARVQGDADVWSAPGRGVRVTLRVPAATAAQSSFERAADELAHRLPDRSIRLTPTGHDDVADRDRHIAPPGGVAVFRAAQNEVGDFAVGDDLQAGALGETFETGAQQGTARHDSSRRSRFHRFRMAVRDDSVVVTTAPFSRGHAPSGATDEVRSGRTIIAAFLSYRFAGLATGFAAVAGSADRYRSRRAARALLAGAAIESIWTARRLWRSGAQDERATGVDALAAMAAVVASRANVAPEDRGTFVDWPPWGFAAPAVAGQGMTGPALSSQSIARAAAIAATTSATISTGISEVVSNMIAMAGIFTGGHLIAGQIRNGARRARNAQSRAVDEGVLLAAEQERARQLRMLHDSALQTLEAVAAGRYRDAEMMRVRALDEAERLQREVEGAPARPRSLADEITKIAGRCAVHGLTVDVRLSAHREPAEPVALALRDACNEALTNVVKHAGVHDAVVTIVSVGNGIEVVVRDDGSGFEPAGDIGFGTRESIRRRLSDVGGQADVRSRPGAGTRVTLWGPL